MSEEAILGCGPAYFKKESGRPDTTKNRLYRILVPEVAHLICQVLRWERRIRGEDDPKGDRSERAIQNGWYGKINERTQIDYLLEDTYLYENMALKAKAVYKTWMKCSTNEEGLHRDWCRRPGILMGKDPG